MRVVFLDVDGPLNTPESGYGGFINGGLDEYYHEQIKWHQPAVDNVRRIVETTGASIVVSSFWRLSFSIADFKKMFAIYGWPDVPIVDATSDLSQDLTQSRFTSIAAPRAEEVVEWLSRHPEVESYVILDDMIPADFYMSREYDQLSAFRKIGDRYIVIDPTTATTAADVQIAVSILMCSES